MFFLLRTAFWISVVLVLLPTGETKPVAEASRVGAYDALSAATSAVSDMTQFCSRNPEACETGAHAAAAFGQRAQAGAKMVYDFLSERAETGSVTADKKTAEHKPGKEAKADKPDKEAKADKPSKIREKAGKSEKAEKQAAAKSQHTLKATDMAPAYREPRREASQSAQARDKRG